MLSQGVFECGLQLCRLDYKLLVVRKLLSSRRHTSIQFLQSRMLSQFLAPVVRHFVYFSRSRRMSLAESFERAIPCRTFATLPHTTPLSSTSHRERGFLRDGLLIRQAHELSRRTRYNARFWLVRYVNLISHCERGVECPVLSEFRTAER